MAYTRLAPACAAQTIEDDKEEYNYYHHDDGGGENSVLQRGAKKKKDDVTDEKTSPANIPEPVPTSMTTLSLKTSGLPIIAA